MASKNFSSILKLEKVAEKKSDSVDSAPTLTACHEGSAIELSQPHSLDPSGQRSFAFDRVFSADERGEDVYRQSVRDVVESTLLGYHGAVLSLAPARSEREKFDSMIRAEAARQFLRCLNKSKETKSGAGLVVLCSFVAVMEERIHDLLLEEGSPGAQGTRGSSLEELEESGRHLGPPRVIRGNLIGATSHRAESVDQVMELIERGKKKEAELLRKQHGAGLDGRSKRTHHTAFMLVVEYEREGSMNSPVSGNLWLVELAASDYLDEKENKTTHQSLVHFASVVQSLTPGIDPSSSSSNGDASLSTGVLPNTPHSPVPHYERAVVTHLLKEALGGNCKTLLLCHMPERMSNSLRGDLMALQLCSKARTIQNNANRQEVAEKALMSTYMREMARQYGMGEESPQTLTKSSKIGVVDLTASSVDRKRKLTVELAASALAAAAIETANDEDSVQQHVVHWTNGKSKSSEDITIDALVAILQHADKGANRPLPNAIKDVRIRKDAGAIFSGAAIVQWMVENVAGIQNEEDAEKLGQLMLDKDAIFHSEGSMIFANAESLFYYAKSAPPSSRALSKEEIKEILASTSKTKDDPLMNTTIIKRIPVPDTIVEEEVDTSPTDKVNLVSDEKRHKSLPVNALQEVSSNQQPLEQDLDLTASNTLHKDKDPQTNTSSYLLSSDHDYQEQKSGDEELDGPQASGEEELDGPQASGEEELDGPQASGEKELDGPQASGEKELDGPQASGENDGEETQTDKEDLGTTQPNTAVLEKKLPSVNTLKRCSRGEFPHPLHMAAAVGKSPGVIKNLVMFFGVDKCDELMRTPLMFAALGNKPSSVSALVDCGAEVNHRDSSGLTAIHVACYHGNKRALTALLNKQASVIITDKLGHSPLHWSTVPQDHSCLKVLLKYADSTLVHHVDKRGLTALHWAIHYQHPSHLELLMRVYQFPLKLDAAGRTLLTYAIENQSIGCIKVLMESSPGLLSLPDSNGRTPLHQASLEPEEHQEALLMLLSSPVHKKVLSPDVNSVDSYGCTPLHFAVMNNRPNNVKALLQFNALQNATDKEGRTPLDYAMALEEGADEMVAILEGHATDSTAEKPGVDITTSESSSNSKICVLL